MSCEVTDVPSTVPEPSLADPSVGTVMSDKIAGVPDPDGLDVQPYEVIVLFGVNTNPLRPLLG